MRPSLALSLSLMLVQLSDSECVFMCCDHYRMHCKPRNDCRLLLNILEQREFEECTFYVESQRGEKEI